MMDALPVWVTYVALVMGYGWLFLLLLFGIALLVSLIRDIVYVQKEVRKRLLSLRNMERKIRGYQLELADVEQTLGQAMDYSWYKDDQKNFPGATEEDGVCVGEHVPGSLAAEAARRIEAHKAAVAVVNQQAEDEGIWFIAETITEDYLQQELRKLHAVIETQGVNHGDESGRAAVGGSSNGRGSAEDTGSEAR